MNSNKKRYSAQSIITLIMIFMVTFVMVFATACNNDSSTSDSSTVESSSEDDAVDEQTLANGDFEWKAEVKTVPIYSSSTGWSKRNDSQITTALSSTKTSGIIDTEDEAYDTLSNSYKPTDSDDNYYNPGTPLSNGLIENDEDTEVNEEGTKVLMIHNVTAEEGRGTAQYFESSTTLTTVAGKANMISVWVQTYQIKSKQDNDNYGAYIMIENSVSSDIEPILIKNIDTNGEWVNYQIYLEPSNYGVTKYNVRLGLGFGSKTTYEEYVEGFAFFDNVEYSEITTEEYQNVNADAELSLFDENNVDVTLEEIDDENNDAYNEDAFIVDEFFRTYADDATPVVVKSTLAKKKQAMTDIITNTDNIGEYNDIYTPGMKDDKLSVAEYDAGFTADKKTSTFNGGNELSVPANSIFMNFQNQAVGSSYTYTLKNITLSPESFTAFMFDAKVICGDTSIDANVSVMDNGKVLTTAQFSSFNTNDYENEDNDDYATYTFYLANYFAEDITIDLAFSFGPTDKTQNNWDLPVGYAIFTNFNTFSLIESEYTIADTSTNTKAVKSSVLGDNKYQPDEEVEDEEEKYEEILKDTYTMTVNSSLYPQLENSAVSEVSSSYFAVNNGGATGVETGIVNSYYRDNYTYGDSVKQALAYLEGKEQLNGNNGHVQPLMINNTIAANYGYLAKESTLTSYSTYIFSVKVKVTGDAKAYIYLVDTGDDAKLDYDAESTSVTYYENELVYGETTKAMSAVVTADTNTTDIGQETTDGYVLVSFVVKTGNANKTLRLEMWNGSRDGSVESTGAVFFDQVVLAQSSTISDEEDLADKYSVYTFTNDEYTSKDIYHYYDEYVEGDESNRVTDDDGNDVFDKGTTSVVYATSGEGTIQMFRYDTIDIDEYKIVISEDDDSTSASDSTSDSTSTEADNYAWLQVSSILIALALIAMLVAVVIRKFVTKGKKKEAKVEGYYQGYNKDNRVVPVNDDEEEKVDYDYDNMDNNVDKD